MIRPQSIGLREVRFGLCGLSLRCKRHGAVEIGIRVTGIETDCAVKALNGFNTAVHLSKRISESVVGCGQHRRNEDCVLVFRDRSIERTERPQNVPVDRVSHCKIGLKHNRFFKQGRGFVETRLTLPNQGEIVKRFYVLRVRGDSRSRKPSARSNLPQPNAIIPAFDKNTASSGCCAIAFSSHSSAVSFRFIACSQSAIR